IKLVRLACHKVRVRASIYIGVVVTIPMVVALKSSINISPNVVVIIPPTISIFVVVDVVADLYDDSRKHILRLFSDNCGDIRVSTFVAIISSPASAISAIVVGCPC
nr:hypothetical protein [Tanacetum cinerariifolium]